MKDHVSLFAQSGLVPQGPGVFEPHVTAAPDAMTIEHGRDQLPARVLLLVGDQAELTTPERGADDPVRVPVERLVADTGLTRRELRGARLLVRLGVDGAPERFDRAG